MKDFVPMCVLIFLGSFCNCAGNSVFNAAMMLALPEENRGAILGFMQSASVGGTALSSVVSKPFRKHTENQVTMTEDELNDIVENISEEDGFDQDKGELVKSALHFSNLTALEIMVEWDGVEKICTASKTPQILETVKNSVHSRFPVVDRNGNLKGILNIRKFLRAYGKSNQNIILASVMDYPYFVNGDAPIDEVLTELSNHRRNMAIVRGEGGKIAGILTVEDILEELVGEIYDENDVGGVDE